MTKSKIKLLSNTIIIIFLCSVLYTTLNIQNKPPSHYSSSSNMIEGTITKCNKKSFILKGKEKVIINKNQQFNCQEGIKIKAIGKFEKARSFNNFHIFNYQKYLYSQRISYVIVNPRIIKLNAKISPHYTLKNMLVKHINKYKSKNYLNTFIFGNTKNIDEKAINSYRNNGISHLFAISGMHITTISIIILFLLNKVSKYKKTNYLIIITILLFYMFLVSFSASVIRATFLFICLTINKVFKLKVKGIYFLLLICSINLFINPYNVYNIAFILSYSITFYLMLFSKYIKEYTQYITKILIISLISFLASTPILIQNFFQINLLSPLINIIFVPIISLIIYPLALLTVFLPFLDSIFYIAIKGIENLSIIINNYNFFTIVLKKMNYIGIIFYYITITLILYRVLNKKTYTIVFFILVILIHHNINYFDPSSNVTILDVGQGDSIFLKTPKTSILIDTGGLLNYKNTSYKLEQNIITPYLKSEGIEKLSHLILSHGDFDHMGEAINLVNNFKVEKVIFNCGPYNDLEKELIKVLNKKKIKYYSCIKELKIDNNKLYFLQTKKYDNENNNSNVIYTELNDYKFLFMGDSEIDKENDILEKYDLPYIDVLKVGHHGSNTSSGKEFINKINPKYSIISVGKNNRYGHPNKEVLNTLKDSRTYRTDDDGSIMFKNKNNKLKIETCSP